MTSIYARLTFTNELLGTASGDPEIHREFIASKAPDAKSLEEEVASVGVDEVVDKKSTIFSRQPDGSLNIWDYQLKGQFKAACGALRSIEKAGSSEDEPEEETEAAEGTETKKKPGRKKAAGKKQPAYACGKLTNYLKKIDTLVHVYPRAIKLHMPEGAEVGNCQRPLRAKTAQGDRVALANSESVPEGTYCDVEIVLFDDSHEAAIRECLDFGYFYGLGQWRNSGKGRFKWQELDGPGGKPINNKSVFAKPAVE